MKRTRTIVVRRLRRIRPAPDSVRMISIMLAVGEREVQLAARGLINDLRIRAALRAAQCAWRDGCVQYLDYLRHFRLNQSRTPRRGGTPNAPSFYRRLTFGGRTVALHPTAYWSMLRRVVSATDGRFSLDHIGAVVKGEKKNGEIASVVARELTSAGVRRQKSRCDGGAEALR